MEVRQAAKGLITCDDYRKYLFVAGSRGMWTLPGGGIDEGETPKQAFLREADEEVTNLSSYLSDPKETYRLEGPVTTSAGIRRIAHWIVFSSTLRVPHTQLTIPERSEITDIDAFTPQECVNHDNMSVLAKFAVMYQTPIFF